MQPHQCEYRWCTGVYLIDKVVHQQIVLYNSRCELLVIHHILKAAKSQT